jgi:hypothetical protein
MGNTSDGGQPLHADSVASSRFQNVGPGETSIGDKMGSVHARKADSGSAQRLRSVRNNIPSPGETFLHSYLAPNHPNRAKSVSSLRYNGSTLDPSTKEPNRQSSDPCQSPQVLPPLTALPQPAYATMIQTPTSVDGSTHYPASSSDTAATQHTFSEGALLDGMPPTNVMPTSG